MSTESKKTDVNKVSLDYTEKDQERAQKKYLSAKTKQNKALYEQLKKEADNQAKQTAEANKKPKGKQVHLVALSNLSGAYNLPYSEGQDFKIHEKQAKELLEFKDAEIFKVKK